MARCPPLSSQSNKPGWLLGYRHEGPQPAWPADQSPDSSPWRPAGWMAFSANPTQNGCRFPASRSPFLLPLFSFLAFVLDERRLCVPARGWRGGVSKMKVLKVKHPTAADFLHEPWLSPTHAGLRLVTEAVSAHETPLPIHVVQCFFPYQFMKKHKYR